MTEEIQNNLCVLRKVYFRFVSDLFENYWEDLIDENEEVSGDLSCFLSILEDRLSLPSREEFKEILRCQYSQLDHFYDLFVKRFELARRFNSPRPGSEFSINQLKMFEQKFENEKSEYDDIYNNFHSFIENELSYALSIIIDDNTDLEYIEKLAKQKSGLTNIDIEKLAFHYINFDLVLSDMLEYD